KRVFDETEHNGLHTKGYYFRHGSFVNILVGSSNLTNSALKGNLEWNLAVSSTAEGSLVDRFEEAFDLAWNSPTSKPLTAEFCASYERYRNEIRAQGVVPIAAVRTGPIEPNAMQAEALGNLALCRDEGKPRALVISATGTGKTYLAALDVKQAEPNRVLFVVHRERIAAAAKESFERVLDSRYTYGLYGGGHRDVDATCLFSTVQTLSRLDNLTQFAPDEFDYIIFDEVHRAGAESYQNLFAYFEPTFLLGMSATPERSDSFDIFEMFDHVVAYEIRLQGALENHLVTPFQYFGVSTLDDTDSDLRTRKDYEFEAEEIDRQSRKYGYSGPRLKGLIFCSRLEECEAVSQRLNEFGYRTAALTGAAYDTAREEAMARLEQNEPDGALDFILTVDIFNEGIDIPTVNQVIMIRPTESAIVFVQQLGRGLRTCAEKEYVTIIDFVSNYSKNYNIPIALNGNRTLQKEELRHLVAADGSHIPGNTTIQFDRIARQRVLKSINETNFSKASFFRNAYAQLKRRLGRIPMLEEFREWGEASPYLILNPKSPFGSYHEFLAKHEDEYQVEFSDAQRTMLKFVCGEIADGKRPSDLIAVRALMEGPTSVLAIAERIATWDKLAGIADHNLDLVDEALSAVNLLCLDFLVSTARNKNIPLCTAADNNG
ncbi:MAG: DEAD/DEAH box helicase family protein, partial [Atopobiaceae bacterium]|nr:DEAD/DEAH box helicase family protein [Atopobiaceae bacterium]